MHITTRDQLVQIQRRLRASGASTRRIAEETGLGTHWLVKFRQNKIPDPGVIKVGKVLDFLEKVERS